MGKYRKKRAKYNQEVVKQLSTKYKVSISFVTKSLSQTRNSAKAKAILEEYNRINTMLEKYSNFVLSQI